MRALVGLLWCILADDTDFHQHLGWSKYHDYSHGAEKISRSGLYLASYSITDTVHTQIKSQSVT